MKKGFPAILSLLFLTACLKPVNISTAYSLNFNGTRINGNVYTAWYRFDSTSHTQNFTARLYPGVQSNNQYVQLQCTSTNYVQPNTYTFAITGPNQTTINLSYTDSIVVYAETAGTLQVTQIDTINHTISGKFQFNAINPGSSPATIAATNGTFNKLNYTIQ